MFLTIKFLRLIMASASVLIFSPVNAFDLGNGFRTNMTEEQVIGLLKGQFERVLPVSITNPRWTSYIATSTSLPGAVVVGFCDGYLASYQSEVNGDFPAFVWLIERQGIESGIGKYTASTVETQFGSSRSINFVWGLGQDTKTITMYKVGTLSSVVTVRFDSPSTCQ